MRAYILLLVALAAFIADTALAQTKTASVVANCRSFELLTLERPLDRFTTLYTAFTTFDGQSGIPLYERSEDEVAVNGEFRPRAGKPGVYETDYVSFTDFSFEAYGSGTINLPVTDTDKNGLPDISQKDKAVDAAFTGTARSDWPAVETSTISGRLRRKAGATEGTVDFILKDSSGTVAYAGVLRIPHVSGSASYSRNQNPQLNLQLVITDIDGETTDLTGTTPFTINNANELGLPRFSVKSKDGDTYVVRPSKLTRTGTKYIGSVELEDGALWTSWRDYTQWVLEIIDSNDADKDGIPDLSDSIPLAPTISAQPQSQTVAQGSTVTLTVAASADPAPVYQWQYNGVNIPKANANRLVLAKVLPSHSGSYRVIVSNSVGSVTSSSANLVVIAPPLITAHPVSKSVPEGTNVTFEVAAKGDSISCQWFKNGQAIPGATGAKLLLTDLTGKDAGSYSAILTNLAGRAVSKAAVLTVTPRQYPPSITSQPASQTTTNRGKVTFTVVATGTAPLRYQWQFNGTNIAKAVAASLVIPSAGQKDVGDYRVLVSNTMGAVTSQVARLTISDIKPKNLVPVAKRSQELKLNASGKDGVNYLLQSSTDLMHWTTLSVVQPTNGMLEAIIPIQEGSPQKFYRFKEPEEP